MPTLFCCILNCESESVNSKKRKIFYRLPQNTDRKQLWLNQIGERIKYGTVSSNSRICNSHFATGKPNLDSSHVDYMPTIFPWSTKEEKLRSFKSVEEYESKIKELEQKILAKAFLNASSGSKLSQESSTTKFEIGESEICSKLIIDTADTTVGELSKHRQKTPGKSNVPVAGDSINGMSDCQRQLERSSTTGESVNKVPIFKESLGPVGHANQLNNNIGSLPPTIQLIQPDTVSIKSNLINYLLSSLARVNMTAVSSPDLAKSLSVNVSMPTAGPLNLSQSFNKVDDQISKKDKTNELDINKKDSSKKEFVNQPEPNIESTVNFSHIKNSFNVSQTPDRTGTPSEETTSRSCTCTKSSCLKLYCECFANGNLCCSGCTCINCRNNDNYKEERAKIVSSYLERDPWVFNSKIENKEVGKKHSKGCNCLKSSCLKNYCECFENKVFCSSLCRCRMCYNNEEHTQHNNSNSNSNKDDTKIYASSHTSESLSVLSENSPRNVNRKRKKSSIKTNEIYEDVSSNDSEDEVHSKRCQLDVETVSVENDKRSNRSINSMEIPPVLPQEDDFTEEELALMVKFREQRCEKPSTMKTECVSPPTQFHSTIQNLSSSAMTSNHPVVTTTSPLINIPANLDSNFLLTLSKSLAVANLGLNGLNVVNTTPLHDTKRPTGIDLLGLLATQQLMVSRQSSDIQNLNCITVPQNCNHVIPINLTQMPPSSLPQITQLPPTVVTQSRVITTSPTSVTSSICQSKPKLSTEDYVRKHIEAAERAVRADYMRKDSSSYKKPITKQKIKIDPFPLTSKNSTVNNIIKPSAGTNSLNSDVSRVISQPPMISKQQFEDSTVNNISSISTSHMTNGNNSESSVATGLPISGESNQHIPNVALYNWVSVPPAATTGPHSQSVLHTVQMNHQSSSITDADHSSTKAYSTDIKFKHKPVRNKIKSLRQSLQSLRSEIRSLKYHMRADQSRLRRLEKNMHQLRNQIGK